ncbi:MULTISPECIES: hypothetical protein [Streptacidiphilus]|uniref:DUF932 domain-containing protein n=1 Tax=Streptacidiphilus cavernicola TaxID=3342716 RepID=A0ABV6V0B1_9ACTN|nr:hypothetical protein [Streptacidiphilus jeojiense]
MTVTLAARTPSRNASLGELAALLQDEHHRKLDVVAPASTIRAEDGRLIIQGTAHELSPTGVTTRAGAFRPTGVCEAGIAEKLGIPVGYLRKVRTEAPELWDANVNGWLDRTDRSFMVRTLLPGDQGEGVARAMLSTGYRIIDNLDILTAALDGVRSAGVDVRIDSCDLSDKRMYVRIIADQVRAYAPKLLRNYRSPFTGDRGADNPVVFAGFEISNSETGCGAFTITPRLVFKVCNNGMTITRDAERNVHLGGRHDDGVVKWSNETVERVLQVVTSKTADAVRTFLRESYVQEQLHRIESTAGTPITNPEETITTVSKALRFNEDTRAALFNHFIAGGDVTAGGVLHAVTSVAQTLPDADEAHDLEAQGLRAMELAAAA